MKLPADYWIGIAACLVVSAGVALIVASLRRKSFKPQVEPLPILTDVFIADIDASRVYTGTITRKCSVCHLEHGSDAAWDGNKQACIDALLAKIPKRGEHGRFAKRA